MLTRSLAKKAKHDSAVKVHLPPGVLQLILSFNDGSSLRQHKRRLKAVHLEIHQNYLAAKMIWGVAFQVHADTFLLGAVFKLNEDDTRRPLPQEDPYADFAARYTSFAEDTRYAAARKYTNYIVNFHIMLFCA